MSEFSGLGGILGRLACAMLAALLRSAMDFVFPWSCAVCASGFEGPGPLCTNCAQELAKLEQEPCCRICAMTLPMHGSPCPYCMGKGPPHFERVARLAPFHGPVRALVHHLKYHRRWGIGEELAHRLLQQETVKSLLQETQLLVPVPLHWKRQVTRGYNQAEVVARRLGSACNIPVARPVRRIRNTETQTHMHSHARRTANLHHAFALTRPDVIAARHVTLIDDVWTTGATMHALAQVLKPAKPASLSAIVLATADPRGLERSETWAQAKAPEHDAMS
jgi:ComF family protein